MTKEELFQKMEMLMNVLKQYKVNQTLDFGTQENLHSMVDVMKEITGKSSIQMDLTCPTCVLAYLNQILPTYEKMQRELQPTVTETKPKRQSKKRNGTKS
ncbi:MAG: hypothetical protein QM737_02780 [Ferruginibacter sp.]